MAFSQVEILEEFVEAASTVDNWSAMAETAEWTQRLRRMADNRERASAWYRQHRHRKIATQRAFRNTDAGREAMKRYQSTPARKAWRAEYMRIYNQLPETKALKRAWAQRRRDALRASP